MATNAPQPGARPSVSILDLPIAKLVFIKQTLKRRARQLNIITTHDLLHHYPKEGTCKARYDTLTLTQLLPKQPVQVEGYARDWIAPVGRAPLRLVVEGVDGRVYHVPFWGRQANGARHRFILEQPYLLKGTYKGQFGQAHSLNDPTLTPLDHAPQPIVSDQATPVLECDYPGTDGLDSKTIREGIVSTLGAVQAFSEWLPADLVQARGLLSFDEAIRLMHMPTSQHDHDRARARFIYEELFAYQVVLQWRQRLAIAQQRGLVSIPRKDGIAQRFWDNLPFTPTDEQSHARTIIDADMRSPKPMKRLLQGDVGTGKTIVAAHAMLRAVDEQRQALMMAPTQVLAEQHFRTFHDLIGTLINPHTNMPVHLSLLTGSLTAKAKRQVAQDLADGTCDLLITTQGVIEEAIEFKDLGLVVIDEQHRFGVEHRRLLADKRTSGETPDLLVMTATPIPRSLALTVHGDLSMTELHRRPGHDEFNVQTTMIMQGDERLERMWAFVQGEVAKGLRVYVVCPYIEQSEIEGREHIRAAIPVYHELATRLAPISVGLVHGNMPVDERERVLQAFKDGSVPVLVSTTIIEVGVSIDEASMMIIQSAEQFGVATLHQLRGRLLRGHKDNVCVLIQSKPEGADDVKAGQLPFDSPGEPHLAQFNHRLRAIQHTLDGFELAKVDLAERSEGDVLSIQQSGQSSLTIASLARDEEIIAQAYADVSGLFDSHPPQPFGEGEGAYDSLDPVMQPIIREVARRHPPETWRVLDAG